MDKKTLDDIIPFGRMGVEVNKTEIGIPVYARHQLVDFAISHYLRLLDLSKDKDLNPEEQLLSKEVARYIELMFAIKPIDKLMNEELNFPGGRRNYKKGVVEPGVIKKPKEPLFKKIKK